SHGLAVATRASLVRAGLGAAVEVVEPHDVFELRRRDLDDSRVLERGHAVHRPGREMEGRAGADDLHVQHPLAGSPQLELRTALEHVPRLVLLLVELQAERLAAADEEDLAGVLGRRAPDTLGAPR